MPTVIDKLKSLSASGYSNKELAEKIGVSVSHISRLLNGLRKHVGYDIGIKIDSLYRTEELRSIEAARKAKRQAKN